MRSARGIVRERKRGLTLSRGPLADGVKVSLTVQLAEGAMAAPMQLLVGAVKSVGLLPPTAIAE